MALTKIKIKEFISLVNEKNTEGYNLPFLGLNRDKTFMPTVATTNGLENKKYKIVRRGYFVYSGMQTGRDNCIRLGYYTDDSPALISPAYVTFVVNDKIIIPEYFFMFFNSEEKDRYGAFLSDGSIRSNLDWNFFCNIEMELPPLEIQKKYVKIYEGLINNQKTYKDRFNNLKICYEGYIENLRTNMDCQEIGNYIEQNKELNTNNNVVRVVGLFDDAFKEPRSKGQKSDISTYQIIRNGSICYPPPHFGNIGTIGLYNKKEPALISPMYVIFKSKDEQKLLPEYLMLWFGRSEFKRYAGFHSDGSIRDTFDYGELSRFKIPIPNISIQNSIVNIYKSLTRSKEINEMLKKEIQTICPILIRGSIMEAEQLNG